MIKSCKKPSEASLQRAIYNIEKHYLLVGVLEDFTTTLKLFERLLPAYFTGSSRLYAQNRDMLLYSGRTKLKLGASPETMAVLRGTKQIKYEMRLYNYVLDVFYDKVEKYGLLN